MNSGKMVQKLKITIILSRNFEKSLGLALLALAFFECFLNRSFKSYRKNALHGKSVVLPYIVCQIGKLVKLDTDRYIKR